MNTERRPDDQIDADDATARRNAGRRRLIRGGLAAGPVILTLGSQPVFGTGLKCVAPSQTLSAAASHTGQVGSCSCYPVSHWKSTGYSWPSGCDRNNLKYHDVYVEQGGAGCSFFTTSNGYTGQVAQTMYNVLCTTDSVSETARLLSCAYLNIRAGKVSFPVGGVVSQTKMINSMQEIWREFVLNGYYEPFAGKKWYAADIKNYLISQGMAAV